MSNLKTTISGIGSAVMALLGALASIPYELGTSSLIISPEWKQRVALTGFISAFLLKVIQSITSADAKPTPPPDPPIHISRPP